jgi:transposase-like protein
MPFSISKNQNRLKKVYPLLYLDALYVNAKAVAADLKPIYHAATLEEAEMALDAFAARWDELYPFSDPTYSECPHNRPE